LRHAIERGFRRDSILDLGLKTTGMEFASEMVVFASLRGLDIREVPTGLDKDKRNRPPHLNTWRDGWRHLRFLLLHSPRWMFAYPGIALVAMGAVLVTALMPGRLELGSGVSLDIRAFLMGCLALVLGVQSITFGLIARRFAGKYQLLPGATGTQRLLDAISLERMLQLGGVVGAAGVAGLVYAISIWADQDFGPLLNGTMLRSMMLSVSGIVVGVQLGLSAFLLGVLDMRPNDVHAQQGRLRATYEQE